MIVIEQDYQTKILQWLFSEGIFAFKVVNATTSGHTDIICCVKGIFVGIEVKRDNQKATPLQQYTHKRILKSGGMAIVTHPSEFNELKRIILVLKLRGHIRWPNFNNKTKEVQKNEKAS